MKGTSRNKVVSSGRLTGLGRGHPTRRRITGGQTPKSVQRPSVEPDYSLYSTDSEDQVTTLHKGLDRCAALLNGILQSDRAEPKPNLARAAKGAATKPRAHSSLGKDTVKKRASMKPISKTAAVQGTALLSQPGPAEINPSLSVTRQQRPAGPALRTTAQSSEVDPGLTASGQSDPCGSSFGAKPQSGTDYEGVVHFNCRLTTSTPTLGPEEPLLTLAEHPTGSNPPGHPGQHQASSGGAERPLEPHACRQAFESLSLPAQPQTLPLVSLLTRPHSHPRSLACSLPSASGSVPRTGYPAARGVLGHSYPPLGVRKAPKLPRSTSPPASIPAGAPCSCSVHLCELHQPSCQAAAEPGAQPPLQSTTPAAASPPGAGSRRSEEEEQEEQEEEDRGPVRDASRQTGFDPPAHAAVHGPAVTPAGPDLQPEAGHLETSPPNTCTANAQAQHTLQSHSALGVALEDCTTEMTERRVKTLQFLLGELKALLAGQDVAAERLLCDLEQTAALLPAMVGSCNIQAEIALALQPLRSENTQLRRRVRILNLQLHEREKAERERRVTDNDSEVLTLQAELGDAQSQLQELRGSVAELRQALLDTQSQLQQSEAENSHLRTDLEDTTSRLLESQRQRGELALVAQQRLEEIQTLQDVNRMLQDRVSSAPPVRMDSSLARPPSLTKQVLDQHQSWRDPAEPAPDPVGQYLNSLSQSGRVPASPPCKGPASLADTQAEVSVIDSQSDVECVSNVATVKGGPNQAGQTKWTFAPLREAATSSHPVLTSQQGGGFPVTSANSQSLATVFKLLHQSKSLISPHLDQSGGPTSKPTARRQLDIRRCLSLDSTLFRSEEGSVVSDWSVGSGSSFNTKDEVEFRNGLAALDASIASLQRTIKMDLAR